MADNDGRIELVARALSKADGKDPDIKHQGKMKTTKSGDTYTLAAEEIPNWQHYEDEARRFVAAFDAISNSAIHFSKCVHQRQAAGVRLVGR